MSEIGNIEKPKKISRRSFLAGAGTLIAAAGAVILKNKGGKVLETLKPSLESIRPLMEKEITGVERTFVLEESEGKWPVLRKEPNLGSEIGYVKPGIKAKGKEVWGVTYPSYIAASRVVPDPTKPHEVYGKWVRLEEEVPLWEENHSPMLDNDGNQKTSRGFFAENFVTFTD